MTPIYVPLSKRLQRLFFKIILCLGALGYSIFCSAHHSLSHFDSKEIVVKKVVVTEYRFVNPHPIIEAMEATERGYVTWLFEAEASSTLAKQGWTQDSLEIGELVTVYGNPLKNPTRDHIFMDFIQRENGEWLVSTPATFNKYMQDWIEPNPDIFESAESVGLVGTWIRSDRPLVSMHKLPLTHRGRLLLNRFDARLDPVQFCVPMGFPRMMIEPYGLRISESDANSMQIEKELAGTRTIVLGDSGPVQVQEPTTYGSSVGKYVDSEIESGKNEILQVSTSGIVDQAWGTVAGLDSSLNKEVSERFFLSEDGLEMTVQFTVIDPEYLEEPAVFEVHYERTKDYDFMSDPCAD